MHRLALALAGVLIVQSTPSAETQEATKASLIQLIANPNKYNETRVHVVGYIITTHEDEALFLSKEDYENGVFGNSIKLALKEDVRSRIQTGQYVEVEGVFRIKPQNRPERWEAGSLVSITRIEPWLFVRESKQGRGCW